LIALGNNAAVRVDNRPVRLSYQGTNLRGGGTFRSASLAVTIEGIPLRAAQSTERIGEFVVVSVDLGERAEQFSALWTC
jgi:hypothetical protein